MKFPDRRPATTGGPAPPQVSAFRAARLRGANAAAVSASLICIAALATVHGSPSTPERKPAGLAATETAITPVLPSDPGVPGFHFPESEATLLGWNHVLGTGAPADAAAAFEALQGHGWGLWTALTAPTQQSFGGERLRVFETWSTPDDLVPPVTTASGVPGAASSAAHRRSIPERLHQFHDGGARGTRSTPRSVESIDPVLGSVKFDPVASEHVLSQGLLHKATLDRLLSGGARSIPPFPVKALVVKPVFRVLSRVTAVEGRYVSLPAWSGPPANAQGWDPTHWPGCVWVDLLGGGGGRGSIDPAAAIDGSSRTDATTYPVSRFIHYHLLADEAAAINQAQPSTQAQAGDAAVLVAMHVAGREISRWTWQTYWWTPDPDHPPSPSSNAVAALRPSALRGAARNYAMALAYGMATPDPSETGGSNAGLAVYNYNPWLEAHFSPTDLPDSQPGYGPDGQPAANNSGVQSNCMSCHTQANYNPAHVASAPAYTGARYVDPADAAFAGTLQVDFLWSLPAAAK